MVRLDLAQYALTTFFFEVLSPRLDDTTQEMTDNYNEQSNFLKLRFPEAEIDFIIAGRRR